MGEGEGEGGDEKGLIFHYPRARRKEQRSCGCWSGISALLVLVLVLFGGNLQGAATTAVVSMRHMRGEGGKTPPLAGTA